jgi:Tfp pilus assembly protein PilO
MQTMAANFWVTVVLLLFIITIVSIVLGIALEAYKVSSKSRQRMQELRNEELRLRLKLEQQKSGAQVNLALPKEPSWEEQSQVSYEMGYQRQQ